jgi:hypothetical protein
VTGLVVDVPAYPVAPAKTVDVPGCRTEQVPAHVPSNVTPVPGSKVAAVHDEHPLVEAIVPGGQIILHALADKEVIE